MYFRDTSDFYLKDLGDAALYTRGKVTFIHSIILGITFFLTLTLLMFPNPLLVFTFDCIANSLI